MTISVKYTGNLQSGKEIHGIIVVKKHRNRKKQFESIGKILLKRYPKTELPIQNFKLSPV